MKSYLNKTFLVQDPEARIRQSANLLKYVVYGPADILPPGKTIGDPKIIPQGTKIRVTNAKSIATKLTFVQTEFAENPGNPLGWTSADNLAGKFINETIGRLTPINDDRKGPTAVWQNGRFVEQATLVEIVGSNNEAERITENKLEPYLQMVTAAAKDDIAICIRSGFRSYPEQVLLFSLFKSNSKKFALAAEPGHSNHQNGTAFDLDVGGFDGNPIYDWLKAHGPDFGFVRTVSKEPWHWEFRPGDAADLAALGKFKLSGVTV